ncbi:hypothetical protein BD310DRAFT_969708 [Dichomitus squalens]|uniref:Uncharacterized protein n=1 Tax=Dichomitus squalens TaxID=114155 RepID=A0A4V6MWP1_9APHY|nr:hypothetical protein BD310DRAFT_969708 [Dichomitus squalens]
MTSLARHKGRVHVQRVALHLARIVRCEGQYTPAALILPSVPWQDRAAADSGVLPTLKSVDVSYIFWVAVSFSSISERISEDLALLVIQVGVAETNMVVIIDFLGLLALDVAIAGLPQHTPAVLWRLLVGGYLWKGDKRTRGLGRGRNRPPRQVCPRVEAVHGLLFYVCPPNPKGIATNTNASVWKRHDPTAPATEQPTCIPLVPPTYPFHDLDGCGLIRPSYVLVLRIRVPAAATRSLFNGAGRGSPFEVRFGPISSAELKILRGHNVPRRFMSYKDEALETNFSPDMASLARLGTALYSSRRDGSCANTLEYRIIEPYHLLSATRVVGRQYPVQARVLW